MIQTDGTFRRVESWDEEEEKKKRRRRRSSSINSINNSSSSSSSSSSSRRKRWRTKAPEMLHLLSAVSVWLVTGTTISSLNKWIFAVYNFRYPLLLSALHMLTAIVVDYGLIKCCSVRQRSGLGEQQDLSPSAKCKVFLLSLTFCASIAFGNMGLNYVQLSFAQMIYTTTPIFTLAISSIILGKQHHILKYTAMMPICLGASFSIMGEVQFDQTGCLFVFAATMLRGVKSIQQSILLQEEKINSVFLLYLMAIPSFCILSVAALVLENWAGLQSPLHYDRRLWGFILLSCLGSVLYNLASCCVISLTSAVTLHILGNLNVVGNLLLSQLLFGSQLSTLSCAGAVLTLSGMIIYQNSEFIAGYLDARRSRATGEQDGKVNATEAESDLDSPKLEPCLELSKEECRSADPHSELYFDLESSLELYQDMEPPSELDQDLEPSSELYQDLEPSSELHQDPEPPSELYQDLDCSSELYQDLEPPSGLYQDIEPSSKLYKDLEPSSELYKDLEPSSELYQDLEPSTEHQDIEHSSEVYQDLEPSLELYQDLEPSSEVNQDLESSLELYQDLEPSSELCKDLELSSELYCDLEPSNLCNDLESSIDLQNDLKPTSEFYHSLGLLPESDKALEPSSELCHHLEPTSNLYHNLESSLESIPDLLPDVSPESVTECHERTKRQVHEKVD